MSAKVRVVRTASRLASTLQAVGTSPARARRKPHRPSSAANSAARPALSDRRSRRFHRRTRDGDARLAPGFTRDFPAAVFLVAAHARYVHHTIRGAARRIHQHSASRKPSRRNEPVSTRHAVHLPRRATFAHHSDRPHPTRQHFRPHQRYLPNIDVTMETAAAYAGAMTIGVVLTGMGNDGATGAKAIRNAGGLVIAQDEATSVIFGMPAEAIKAANVEQVLPA